MIKKVKKKKKTVENTQNNMDISKINKIMNNKDWENIKLPKKSNKLD